MRDRIKRFVEDAGVASISLGATRERVRQVLMLPVPDAFPSLLAFLGILSELGLDCEMADDVVMVSNGVRAYVDLESEPPLIEKIIVF